MPHAEKTDLHARGNMNLPLHLTIHEHETWKSWWENIRVQVGASKCRGQPMGARTVVIFQKWRTEKFSTRDDGK